MKRFLFTLVSLIFIYFIFRTSVFAAQNNHFGVHILFPEEVPLAADLVNSNGGDWGYLVIPIQSTDRNREKWQKFMDDCTVHHLIPIIRLATYPQGQNWTIPNEWDSVDFANFLVGLKWPTKQKIVAVYNEPNHAAEWGGQVNPFAYSDVLADTIQEFKKTGQNFVILNAALDASAPSAGESMDEYEFMQNMTSENPDIFREIDAFNSHSYPNPNFSASPYFPSRYNITSYQNEIDYLQAYDGVYGLSVYITETGWKKNQVLDENRIAQYYKIAYTEIWNDSYVKVIAPFLLRADAGDFEKFSITNRGEKGVIFNTIASIKKERGEPELTNKQEIFNKPNTIKTRKFEADDKNDPLKFKWLWKKIAKWILK